MDKDGALLLQEFDVEELPTLDEVHDGVFHKVLVDQNEIDMDDGVLHGDLFGQAPIVVNTVSIDSSRTVGGLHFLNEVDLTFLPDLTVEVPSGEEDF